MSAVMRESLGESELPEGFDLVGLGLKVLGLGFVCLLQDFG